jgi:flagellar hook-associated protein 1 FlgK
MSITGALSNALSGLTAASRSAEVIASNIANVATEGYAARTLTLSSRQGTMGGVRVDGVQRELSPSLLAERRLADAEQTQSQDLADALRRIEGLFGTPLDPASLSAGTVALESALIEASSRPDLPERLQNVIAEANALTGKFRGISDGLQAIRTEADRSIATQVDQLNSDLEAVQMFNQRIVSLQTQGGETASLLDARQIAIDRINHIVPVMEVARSQGAVALFTAGGAVLLDGRAVRIGFERANVVAPQMTQSGGLLSGLTVNNVPVSTDHLRGPLSGGGLAAAFQVRDDLAPAAQQKLDGLARDLIERFGAPSVDPTLSLGQPGMFTDASGPLDPATESGLAGRLSVNPALDPAHGGRVTRLRDGLGTTTPAPPGDAAFLNRMIDGLAARQQPSSGSLDPSALSFSELLSRSLSDIGGSRQRAEQRLSFAGTRAASLKAAELERGVDTDEQLQRLMMIEQAYLANARVIQAVDDMMQSLLRI